MKKNILFILVAFAAGFLTHALLFPDFLANGFTDVSRIVIPPPSPSPGQKVDPLITKVTFDGTSFSHHGVTVQFSRYIQIINTSKTTPMWLTSTLPELATQRGYGESETVQAAMDKRGQFVVADKNNPSERLVITVK